MAGNARDAGTFTFGEQLGSGDLEKLPKGIIGRAILQSDVTSIGTSETDLLSITNVPINAGREVWAFSSFNVQNDSASGWLSVAVRIYQGGTQIGSRRRLLWAATDFEDITVPARLTQGSGLFTIRTSIAVANGTSTTAHVVASSAGPGFLWVEDKGPQF